MSKRAAVVLLSLLVAGLAQAERPEPRRQIIVIPKTYVSPGAAGSIGGYQHHEQRQLINGRPVPGLNRRETLESGDYRFQQRGGIRQSTEYPGGLRIERIPGSGGYETRERR